MCDMQFLPSGGEAFAVADKYDGVVGSNRSATEKDDLKDGSGRFILLSHSGVLHGSAGGRSPMGEVTPQRKLFFIKHLFSI